MKGTATQFFVYKAQGCEESCSIEMRDELPDLTKTDDWMTLSDKRFEIEAGRLFHALVCHLPGGTLDRLIARLLRYKAGHFVINFGDLEGTPHIDTSERKPPSSRLDWLEFTDEDGNTCWRARSIYHHEGRPLFWRLRQRLMENQVEWYEAHDPELSQHEPRAFVSLIHAKQAIQEFQDCLIADKA